MYNDGINTVATVERWRGRWGDGEMGRERWGAMASLKSRETESRKVRKGRWKRDTRVYLHGGKKIYSWEITEV